MSDDPVHDLENRVAKIEQATSIQDRNHTDLAASVSEITKSVARLADWQLARQMEVSGATEREKALNVRLDHIEKTAADNHVEALDAIKALAAKQQSDMENFRGVWVRIQWILITAVLSGVGVAALNYFLGVHK